MTLPNSPTSPASSPYALSRAFKKRMGLTWREYQSAKKIERGIRTLLGGGTVMDAQLDAGHESSSTFTHRFRLHTGISPKSYHTKAIALARLLSQELSRLSPRQLNYPDFNCSDFCGVNIASRPLTLTIANKKPNSVVFVGLYPKPLPSGVPVIGIAIFHQNELIINAIPHGTYYVMACELTAGDAWRFFDVDSCQRGMLDKPVSFPLTHASHKTLTLRPHLPDDPPITTNLPQMLQWALDAIKKP